MGNFEYLIIFESTVDLQLIEDRYLMTLETAIKFYGDLYIHAYREKQQK